MPLNKLPGNHIYHIETFSPHCALGSYALSYYYSQFYLEFLKEWVEKSPKKYLHLQISPMIPPKFYFFILILENVKWFFSSIFVGIGRMVELFCLVWVIYAKFETKMTDSSKLILVLPQIVQTSALAPCSHCRWYRSNIGIGNFLGHSGHWMFWNFKKVYHN